MSKMTLIISVLSITVLAYTAFAIYCFITDISYLINTTAIQEASHTAQLMGIAFYVVYMVVMYISVKKIKDSVSIYRHFKLDDYKAVDLLPDDFKFGYRGKKATVANSIVNSNPGRLYIDTFLKSNP